MGYWVSARRWDSEIQEYRWYPSRRYLYYGKRDAMRLYRQEMGLVGKHIEISVETTSW